MSESMNARIGYYLEGARRSRYHADQWFRYLRKAVTEDGTKLSPEEIAAILGSGELSMFQTVSFQRAMVAGTPTHQHVIGLNQRTETPMVREIRRRHRDAHS